MYYQMLQSITEFSLSNSVQINVIVIMSDIIQQHIHSVLPKTLLNPLMNIPLIYIHTEPMYPRQFKMCQWTYPIQSIIPFQQCHSILSITAFPVPFPIHQHLLSLQPIIHLLIPFPINWHYPPYSQHPQLMSLLIIK
jgi:hypothetical protein